MERYKKLFEAKQDNKKLSKSEMVTYIIKEMNHLDYLPDINDPIVIKYAKKNKRSVIEYFYNKIMRGEGFYNKR